MSGDRLVTVCAACLCAGCWHGELMCEASIGAGTVEIPRRALRASKREHPSNFSDKKLAAVCGGPAVTKRAHHPHERT